MKFEECVLFDQLFTCGGFLLSIIPSLAGFVKLGRRLSEPVIIDPFTARNKCNRDPTEKITIKEKQANENYRRKRNQKEWSGVEKLLNARRNQVLNISYNVKMIELNLTQ